MTPRFEFVLVSLVLSSSLLAGCATEAPSPQGTPIVADPPADLSAKSERAGDGDGEIRVHTEAVTRVRFPVSKGVVVDERHHDPTLPIHKFRHSIRLLREGRTVVLIDVWDNPDKRPLRAWFDAHLAFLVDTTTRTTERPMAHTRIAGILLEQPRSPQALSQAIGVFAFGEQVFRVTCIDPVGDPDARRMFDQVIDGIEVGVTP